MSSPKPTIAEALAIVEARRADVKAAWAGLNGAIRGLNAADAVHDILRLIEFRALVQTWQYRLSSADRCLKDAELGVAMARRRAENAPKA